MKEKILVTSALPYANGPLHLGHLAGAYIPADIYVRFNRVIGNDVLFIGGTDEYGVPITLSAQKEGVSPEEIVKKYHGIIKKSFEKMNISFDNFSGTARPVHQKMAQRFFLGLFDNGYISKKDVEQFYCANDDMFLPDRYVEGTCPKCGYEHARGDECPKCGSWLDSRELKNPKCAICGSAPELKQTTHWFFKLNEMQKQLEEWFDSKDIWKDNVKNFVKGWFKLGLQERPITRDLKWGIPVPLEEGENKVIYVWFDAPIGYISSTVEWAEKLGEPEKWKDYWQNPDCKLVHFIGKDNIPFHLIIFPASLMGQKENYILPYNVPANEHLNIEGDKLSTSKGNVIWVDVAVEKFDVDMLRYYLAANAPEKKDADFSFEDFHQRVNKDLCGVYGNLINRTLTFINKHYENIIPAQGKLDDDDKQYIKEISSYSEKVWNLYENFRVREACYEIINCARISNRYFDAKEPWNLVKNDKSKCATVLNLLSKAIRLITAMFYPVIPDKANKVNAMFGFTDCISKKGWPDFKKCDVTGSKLNKIERLFNKITDKEISKVIKDFNENVINNKGKDKMEEQEQISFEDFKKLKLKVAKIVQAEKIVKSNKLLKLQIEIGEEKRQIVAGVSQHYTPEELIGKNIIVVANLKPAKLMGELSQGMMLAAKNDEDGLCLLTTEKPMKSGSEVS